MVNNIQKPFLFLEFLSKDLVEKIISIREESINNMRAKNFDRRFSLNKKIFELEMKKGREFKEEANLLREMLLSCKKNKSEEALIYSKYVSGELEEVDEKIKKFYQFKQNFPVLDYLSIEDFSSQTGIDILKEVTRETEFEEEYSYLFYYLLSLILSISDIFKIKENYHSNFKIYVDYIAKILNQSKNRVISVYNNKKEVKKEKNIDNNYIIDKFEDFLREIEKNLSQLYQQVYQNLYTYVVTHSSKEDLEKYLHIFENLFDATVNPKVRYSFKNVMFFELLKPLKPLNIRTIEDDEIIENNENKEESNIIEKETIIKKVNNITTKEKSKITKPNLRRPIRFDYIEREDLSEYKPKKTNISISDYLPDFLESSLKVKESLPKKKFIKRNKVTPIVEEIIEEEEEEEEENQKEKKLSDEEIRNIILEINKSNKIERSNNAKPLSDSMSKKLGSILEIEEKIKDLESQMEELKEEKYEHQDEKELLRLRRKIRKLNNQRLKIISSSEILSSYLDAEDENEDEDNMELIFDRETLQKIAQTHLEKQEKQRKEKLIQEIKENQSASIKDNKVKVALSKEKIEEINNKLIKNNNKLEEIKKEIINMQIKYLQSFKSKKIDNFKGQCVKIFKETLEILSILGINISTKREDIQKDFDSLLSNFDRKYKAKLDINKDIPESLQFSSISTPKEEEKVSLFPKILKKAEEGSSIRETVENPLFFDESKKVEHEFPIVENSLFPNILEEKKSIPSMDITFSEFDLSILDDLKKNLQELSEQVLVLKSIYKKLLNIPSSKIEYLTEFTDNSSKDTVSLLNDIKIKDILKKDKRDINEFRSFVLEMKNKQKELKEFIKHDKNNDFQETFDCNIDGEFIKFSLKKNNIKKCEDYLRFTVFEHVLGDESDKLLKAFMESKSKTIMMKENNQALAKIIPFIKEKGKSAHKFINYPIFGKHEIEFCKEKKIDYKKFCLYFQNFSDILSSSIQNMKYFYDFVRTVANVFNMQENKAKDMVKKNLSRESLKELLCSKDHTLIIIRDIYSNHIVENH